MPFFSNISPVGYARMCRLCSNFMCSTFTYDEGYEEEWYHCHECDMRDCHEEAI